MCEIDVWTDLGRVAISKKGNDAALTSLPLKVEKMKKLSIYIYIGKSEENFNLPSGIVSRCKQNGGRGGNVLSLPPEKVKSWSSYLAYIYINEWF